MSSDTGDRAEIISGMAFRGHVVEAMIASVTMLQFYDWLLMLPQEGRYIWRASWNWTKMLYLLTRYTPFAIMALVIRNHFSQNPSPESCKRTLAAISWLSFVVLDVVEIVLAVRTYAVWKRDKRVGIGLALLFTLCQIPRGILLQKFTQAANPMQNPYPEILRGCAFGQGKRLVFVNWVVLTVAEGVDLVLMIISAVKTCHDSASNLMHVVYRDGIRFYLFIFCATLTNVLITLLLQIYFSGIGSDIEIVLHSILTCRLMIGIREASQLSGRKSETFELSEVPDDGTLVFARRSSVETARIA